MKISAIHCWTVPLKSHETYYMADGKACDLVDSIVIEIKTDAGISGWGEVCPIPHYLPAYASGVVPAIEEMLPVLLGADPLGPEALMGQLNAWLIGHNYAKSAIDTALWDITAKAAKLPLYTLLGGRCTDTLPLYHSVTCIAADDMARIAKEAYDSGIRQIQVKLGADNNWQHDAERLTKVREIVGAGPLVYGDWNCGAQPLDAIRVALSLIHI